MGKVLTYDQATWSTMKMVREAKSWCDDRSRYESSQEHKAVLESLIKTGYSEVA